MPVKKTFGTVTVEWINDPGKRVSGQWRVSCQFWEVFPTDAELKDLVFAARAAMAEHDVSSSWREGGVCLRCGRGYELAHLASFDHCPSCGYRGEPFQE